MHKFFYGCENDLQSWNPTFLGIRSPNPLSISSGLGNLTNKMTTSISPLHLFSAIVSLIVLPLTRPKRALQPSRFHIRLKCAIQQEELLTLRVRRRAKHAINSDSGAPFSSLRRSTRCTRRSWSPVSSLLFGRVGLGNGEYLVGVGKSSEVVRSWEGGEVQEQPSWNIWQF